jgi:hypothetical protein
MTWSPVRGDIRLWERSRVDHVLPTAARKAWAAVDDLDARHAALAAALIHLRDYELVNAHAEERQLAAEAIRHGKEVPPLDRVAALTAREHRLQVEIAAVQEVRAERVEALHAALLANQQAMCRKALDVANALGQDAPWQDKLAAAEALAWCATVDETPNAPGLIAGYRQELEQAEAMLAELPTQALVAAAEIASIYLVETEKGAA